MVNCKDKFAKYDWIGEIAEGVGAYGVIYQVFNRERQEKTILKAQVYNRNIFNNESQRKADNEMLVACQMSGLWGYVVIYDYWICRARPVDPVFRRSSIKHYLTDDSHILFYIDMQQLDGTMQDLIQKKVNLSETERLLFLLEYTWIIAYGRKTKGFSHGDIKPDNVFFKSVSHDRHYVIFDGEESKEIIINLPIMPIVADYGSSKLNSSTTKEEEKEEERYLNDVIAIEGLPYWWGLMDFEARHVQEEEGSADIDVLLIRIYSTFLISLELDLFGITDEKRKIKRIKSRLELLNMVKTGRQPVRQKNVF
jgi:serine/threonine protein kinase